MQYLKDKINELKTSSRNKSTRSLYRGINEFKRGYQSRNNIEKDENGDLLANYRNILKRLKNYSCQLLNVHGANDVRQREMNTAKPFLPDSIVILTLKLLLKMRKIINRQVLIRFGHKWSTQELIR
jgi:hypothetical protein